jgi:hypothetical protein
LGDTLTHISAKHTSLIAQYPERITACKFTTDTSHTSHTRTTEGTETGHKTLLQATRACELTCAYDTSSKRSTDASSR